MADLELDAIFAKAKEEAAKNKAGAKEPQEEIKEDAPKKVSVAVQEDTPLIPEDSIEAAEASFREDDNERDIEELTKGITHSVKPSSQKKERHTDSKNGYFVRDFPASLMQMIKRSFPEASNNKALAAYVYATRDVTEDIDYSDVPDDVIELASKFDSYKMMSNMDNNLDIIARRVKALEKQSRLVRFVMTTLVMNANGLLGEHVDAGSKINYTPPDYDLVFKELEAQSEKYWRMIDYQEGRPIK